MFNELKNKCEEMEKEQLLSNCYIEELNIVPIDDAPILASLIKEKFGFSISEEELIANMGNKGTGLGIAFPGDGKFQCYPISDLAYNTIFERAGFGKSPTVLLKTSSTNRADAMCPDDKAAILNKGIKLQKGKCLVIERNKKVLAVHSDKYVYLSPSEILEKMKETLTGIDYAVTGYELCDEYMTATVRIEDVSLKKEIEKVFLQFGKDISDYSTGIILATSDVSLSSVCIFPVLLDKANKPAFILAESSKVAHTGDASIEKVGLAFAKTMTCFSSIDKVFDVFKAMPIKYAGCIFYLTSRLGFDKESCLKYYEEFLDEFSSSDGSMYATGADLLCKVFEMIDECREKLKLTTIKEIQLYETVFRRIKYHLVEDDLPFVNSEV